MLFSKVDLRRLIIPLIIEQFLSVAMGLIDTAMVSGGGPAAISGVHLADNINVLLINIFAALATGGAVVVAQYIGRKDREQAGLAAKQLLYISLFIALVVMILVLPITHWLLKTIFGNTEPEVLQQAGTYFFITVFSFPFLALYNSSAALMRTTGNSKIPTFTALLMNLVNIGGNAVLIYGLDMGVTGAAISTVLCRGAGAIAILIILHKPTPMLTIQNLLRPIWKKDMITRILRIGVPNGIENSLFQLGKIIILRLVATLGASVIAANSVANSLSSVIAIPANAIGLSIITVVGRCVGAKEFKQAKTYTKSLIQLAFVALFVTSLLVTLLLPVLLNNVFQLTGEEYTVTRNMVWMYAVASILIWPFSFGLPNALRAAGDATFTMSVSLISMVVFRILFSYLLTLSFHMGIYGIWIAMFIDWIARAIAFLHRIKSGKWLEKQVI
ncbi:MAG: MATE family efflux transporter [Clostridiales bacterium]|nr:MATE family efflux transporter [Clostridiales bacterium]